MLHFAPNWTALLAGLVLACGPAEPAVPEPPRPENLAAFDPDVVVRIEEAHAAVRADPRRAQGWAELGLVYASERLKSLALDCFRAASRLDPEAPKWPYREAITLSQIGSLPEAIAAMERSLALEPSYPPSHARLGGYRLALGDLVGAERDFRKATELDSTYPGGWIGRARVALQRERSAEAIEILERLLAQDPEDRTFLQLLALARQQAGAASGLWTESSAGEDHVPVWNDPWELEARAFRRKPAMLQIGRLLEQGRAVEALALLEGERARGADPVETALSFATAQQMLGHTQAAERELESVLAREPENSSALLMKANLLEDGGDLAGAAALLERVTLLQPSFGGAFAAKGFVLADLGQHELARAAFQRALELGERDYDLRFEMGNVLVVLKRWPEALEFYEGLVAERPEHGNAWLQVALARSRGGLLDAAEEAIARARATGNADAKHLANVQASCQLARERKARKASEDDAR